MKANYTRSGSEIQLKWNAGLLEPKVIPILGSLAARSAERRADEVFLKLLARFASEGRQVGPMPNAPTYAPTYFAQNGNAEGLKKRGFEQAMNRLFASGKIAIGKHVGCVRQR